MVTTNCGRGKTVRAEFNRQKYVSDIEAEIERLTIKTSNEPGFYVSRAPLFRSPIRFTDADDRFYRYWLRNRDRCLYGEARR